MHAISCEIFFLVFAMSLNRANLFGGRTARLALRIFVLMLPFIAQGQSLEGFIAAALRDHPVTRSAQSQQVSAQAELASAHWQFWPLLSVLAQNAS